MAAQTRRSAVSTEMAKDLLRRAKEWGLEPTGYTPCRQQQTDPRALGQGAGTGLAMFFALAEEGVDLAWFNWAAVPGELSKQSVTARGLLRGGWPRVVRHFGQTACPRSSSSPARSMVGDAGVIRARAL